MSAQVEVSEAAQARIERAIDVKIDDFINEKLKAANLAAPISAPAKIKLRGILKKYSREARPFSACVRDNMKRFGPGRTEAVCATLKDTIKGRKDWRHGKTSKAEKLSIDGEVLIALDAISDFDLQTVFMEARAMDEFSTVEAVGMLDVSASDELRRWGDDGEVGLSISRNAEPEITT